MFIIEILLFCFLFQFGQSTDPNDEQILMDWYNSLQSKGTLNWAGINDLCQQTANQIYCDSSTKRVTRIYLDSYQFQGSISKEFGNLTQLQVLELYNNQLNGTIPTELGNLIQLTDLRLDDNQLTGTIPTELGYLTQLQSLDLGNNQLTGTIPTELGYLTQLEDLSLNNNQLIETIPTELGNLIRLRGLIFSNNQLNGIIPTQFGNLKQLNILDLSYNQLTGTIPTQLLSLSQLNSIYLASNYWDCPTLDYSSISITDFTDVSIQCNLSCLPNPCLNGGQCSTRLNGNYHCECLSGYAGINCENKYPIGFYSFSANNKSLDGTGNGHDLISFKTKSMNYPRTDDPTNQALIFFGNDVISTSPSSPPFTLGDSFSVSVLFSISKFYLTSSLILFTPTDIYGIPSFNLMIYPSGSIQVSLNGKVVLRTANSIISLNTLYLVALIKNGNVMRIFKNGEPVATITNSPLINISNNMMYLAYNFIGILDEVSIYSSPLSKVEIQNQVNQLSLPTKACGGCLNGGICGKIEGGKQCFCSQCFSGNLCEIKMDGCENPCKNGGINVGGVCQCAAGFTGPTCSSYVTCNAFNNSTGIFSQGTAYKGATGTCPGGKNGNPTSQCLHDGTWRTILSPCN